MKAFVNIGCHGRKFAGLTICAGVRDRLADLRRLPPPPKDDLVLDYLEKHVKLFDQHAVDLNQIGSVISFLGDQGILIKHQVNAAYEFVTFHKKCGLYLYVDPLDEELK